jgi:hypothetical protein
MNLPQSLTLAVLMVVAGASGAQLSPPVFRTEHDTTHQAMSDSTAREAAQAATRAASAADAALQRAEQTTGRASASAAEVIRRLTNKAAQACGRLRESDG